MFIPFDPGVCAAYVIFVTASYSISTGVFFDPPLVPVVLVEVAVAALVMVVVVALAAAVSAQAIVAVSSSPFPGKT